MNRKSFTLIVIMLLTIPMAVVLVWADTGANLGCLSAPEAGGEIGEEGLPCPLPGESLPSSGITPAADDPTPPSSPVKLIFIHHSTGLAGR